MSNNSETKIVFMGTPEFSAKILSVLIQEKYNIAGVFTGTDKKIGRSQELKNSAVKEVAKKYGLSIFQPAKLDDKTVEEIKSLNPDLIVVAAYGKILPPAILKIPRYGCLNVHASLLPKYRGPSPIQNALLHGEVETGITIMLMDKGIDTGDIINQKNLLIDKMETSANLFPKLANLGANLLVETIPRWTQGQIKPISQNNNEATLCQLISRNDGKINWSDGASDIYNRWRAFTPWPGIFTFWNHDGKNIRIKLNKISLNSAVEKNGHREGEVYSNSLNILVSTGDGSIIIDQLLMEGKSPIAIRDFINGAPEFLGSILK